MAIINTGQTFTATDTVTNTKLEDIASAATFNDPVDATTLELITGGANAGKLGIKDAGVTTSKVLDSSITKAKIENISAPLKVLGRTTAGAGVAEEVTINDNDDLSTASAITLATDESIKAYVDSSTPIFVPSTYAGEESVTLPNGLIMKFGYKATVATNDFISFSVAFPTVCVNVSATTAEANSTARWPMKVSSLAVGGFDIKHGNATTTNHGAYWQAIGY